MKTKILLYNKFWEMEWNLPAILVRDGFELINNRDYFDKADVVVFHMPNVGKAELKELKLKKGKNQLWVFFSMECGLHYEWQSEKEIVDFFDITMTYSSSSNVPVPYLYPGYLKQILNAPVSKYHNVNAFISSSFDKSNRLKVLSELMRYMEIDSYGKRLNNKQLDTDAGSSTKEQVIARYKFTIAFENAIAEDYVTEKFFEPLIAGSVPVYLGAPNVDDFAPGDHCYVNVNSFSSIKDLAQHLVNCCNDDTKYQQYLEWKNKPLKYAFLERLDLVKNRVFLRLCDYLNNRVENNAPQCK
jgi:hypothetical protein